MGHKTGDNAQVLALAQALGWPYVIKQLQYKNYELFTNVTLRSTLAGVERQLSSPLVPPWPDLVISAGRRNEPVARWIRAKSAGRSRLVHIGRPWSRVDRFDLVITTPQYQVPNGPNVIQNMLPLYGVTLARLNEAAAQWQPRLSHLPRPYFAVLVGGDSGMFTFEPLMARRLGEQVSAMASAAGGSLLVTTSARTPACAVTALRAAIEAPAYFYAWRPDCLANPYVGFLGLADVFVVTGESISMLAEACLPGKPVYIYDLGHYPETVAGHSKKTWRRPWWLRASSYRWKPLSHRIAMCIGPKRMRRDIGVIHTALIESGRAVWLGQRFPQGQAPPLSDEWAETAARVRAILRG